MLLQIILLIQVNSLILVFLYFQANELACLTGHADKVLSVASDTQGRLCSSSLDKSIKLWSPDPTSGTLIGCHDAPVTFVTSLPDKSGGVVLTGSR